MVEEGKLNLAFLVLAERVASMAKYLEPIPISLLVAKVKTDASMWASLRGARVPHAHYGIGILQGVNTASPILKEFIVDIDFPIIGTQTFNLLRLQIGSHFSVLQPKREHLGLPNIEEMVARQVKIRLREERERIYRETREKERRIAQERTKQERELARKWNVPYRGLPSDAPVIRILTRLESRECLSKSDFQTLAEHGAPHLADKLQEIDLLEFEYSETGRPGVLARISSVWKQLQRPDRSLEATGRLFDDRDIARVSLSNRDEAMLLTARGAAHRKLGDLSSARSCANKAVALRSASGHAFCLLGAIDVQENKVSDAEINFSKCEQLTPSYNADDDRREALWSTKHPSEYAAYLLNKDPVRYEWARRFLSRTEF